MTSDTLREIDGIPEHNGEWRGEIWVFSLRLPIARREYGCDGCSEPIAVGERHVSFVTANVEGPGMERWRLHGECYESDQPMFSGTRPEWRWPR